MTRGHRHFVPRPRAMQNGPLRGPLPGSHWEMSLRSIRAKIDDPSGASPPAGSSGRFNERVRQTGVAPPAGARSIGIGHPRSGDRCVATHPTPDDPLRVAEQGGKERTSLGESSEYPIDTYARGFPSRGNYHYICTPNK